MKRFVVLAVLSLLIATAALAHGGHKHQFLGTVDSLAADDLVVTTKENETITFRLTAATKYVKGIEAAGRGDLKNGTRVSITVENDGRTVVTVKIGTARAK